jgi:hypothetical protein
MTGTVPQKPALPAVLRRGAALALLLVAAVGFPPRAAAEQKAAQQKPADTAAGRTPTPTAAADDKDDDDDRGDDLVKKAEIMNSSRWRRAIFELSEWLSAQEIYTPAQVRTIKADFNRKVAKMSSHDLEYLLDDLDAKFKILDTAEARDARAWVGQYLSVLSDHQRAKVLKEVPDVVKMTAAQLQQEILRIEQARASLQRQQAAFDGGRQQLVQQAQAARQLTAQASVAAMRSSGGGASYSPYRGGGGGSPPFANTGGSGMTLTSGPFGAFVSMNLGGF